MADRGAWGAGATVYDTARFYTNSDDFIDTYLSINAALVIGRRFRDNLSLGVIGQVFITYADKERTAELAARSPVLHAFREASSFPIQAFVSWSP